MRARLPLVLRPKMARAASPTRRKLGDVGFVEESILTVSACRGKRREWGRPHRVNVPTMRPSGGRMTTRQAGGALTTSCRCTPDRRTSGRRSARPHATAAPWSPSLRETAIGGSCGRRCGADPKASSTPIGWPSCSVRRRSRETLARCRSAGAQPVALWAAEHAERVARSKGSCLGMSQRDAIEQVRFELGWRGDDLAEFKRLVTEGVDRRGAIAQVSQPEAVRNRAPQADSVLREVKRERARDRRRDQ